MTAVAATDWAASNSRTHCPSTQRFSPMRYQVSPPTLRASYTVTATPARRTATGGLSAAAPGRARTFSAVAVTIPWRVSVGGGGGAA